MIQTVCYLYFSPVLLYYYFWYNIHLILILINYQYIRQFKMYCGDTTRIHTIRFRNIHFVHGKVVMKIDGESKRHTYRTIYFNCHVCNSDRLT